jgi:arylsulfatase A-like enzyme
VNIPALAALLLMLGCGGETPRRLNVLLLTIDTLRADHLSCYGYERATSPEIDRLATQGVLFRNPIVQRGGTWPSLTSILTSMYPHSHGVRKNGEQLDASKKILAELLRGEGYATAAFLTNMISAPNRGFDEKQHFSRKSNDAEAAEAAIRWLEENRKRRFFVWVHLMGPHDPYAPSGRFARIFDTGYKGRLNGKRGTLERIQRQKRRLSERELAHIISLYDGDIVEVDQNIGTIVSSLDRLGLADHTLVVFTSDHGEELYEHNRYFFHSYSIYESVLRVPLVMRLPAGLPQGATVVAPVESIDIAPTILELLGIPLPGDFEGKSLANHILGQPSDAEAVAFSELGPEIFSIRTERWHYIYNPLGLRAPTTRDRAKQAQPVFEIAREELYDALHDPRETTNLVREHPELAAQLRRRLRAWIETSGATYRPQELLPEAERELRALGYLN